MHPQRRTLTWINVLGGLAVLSSYAYGFAAHPASRGAVWGEVPEAIRPVYTVSMLLAAAGYFAFTYFLLLRVDPDRARVANLFRFGLFNALYAAILLPSAMWMPLTFAMIEQPSTELWLAIRLTLAIVGLASLGLSVALVALTPRIVGWAGPLAIAGSVAFSFQTAFLDAVVWPAYFPL
jgi:hypothetical protein